MRWAVPIIMTFLLLPVLLLGALLGGLELPSVQRRLVAVVASHTPIRLAGVGIGWPLDIRAERLSMVDGQGAWLEAADCRLAVTIAALAGGRVDIRHLTAAQVTYLRPPESRLNQPQAAPVMPRLPLAVRLREVTIDRLELRQAGFDGRFSAEGRLEGGHLDLAMLVAGAVGKALGEARLAVDGRGSAVTVVGQGSLRELPLPVTAASWSLAGGFDLASGNGTIGHLGMTTAEGRASLFGLVTGWGRDARLHVSAALPDMSVLHSSLTGKALVSGDLRGRQAVLTVEAAGLGTGIGEADRLLGPAPRARVAVGFDEHYHPIFALAQLRAAEGGFEAGGLVGGSLMVGVQGQAARPGWGEARATGMLTGKPDDPVLSVEADTALDGVTAHLLAVARQVTTQPQGRLRLAVSGRGRNGEVTAAFLWGAEPRFDDVTVSALGGQARGGLVWKDGAAQGHLSGGVPISGGAVRFDLDLLRGHGQEARLTAQAAQLAWPGVVLHQSALHAQADDLLGTPKASGNLTVSAVDLPSARLNGLSLEAGGTAEPKSGRYVLTSLTMRMGSGRLDGSGSLQGEALEGRLALVDLPLTLLAPLLPGSRPTGNLAGLAELHGTLAAPRVHLRLGGHDLDMGGHHAGIDAQALADWDGARLQASLTAEGLRGSKMEASGGLPMTLDHSRLAFPEGPLTGHLQGRADLARLAELVDIGDQTVAGQITFEAAADGTLSQPGIDAHGEITDGRYVNFDSGTVLTAIHLTGVTQDRRHLALRMEGGDGSGGSFTAEGVADLLFGPIYSVDATLKGMHLANLDIARGATDGHLHFEGIGFEAGLSGSLTADDAQVDIGQALPARIVVLDVVEINRPAGEGAGKAGTPAAKSVIALALAVEVNFSRLHVGGRGIDSDWSGRLALGGTLDEPDLLGQLRLLRGNYDLFGRRLTISQGEISFDGHRPIDPRFDLTAQGPARDVTAMVHVTGSADKPQFEFTSDPPVPRDEVLSRLLFGSEAGQLSVTQQLTLARVAAGQLTGGGSDEFDPLGRMKSLLGLDLLEAGGGTDSGSGSGLPGFSGSGSAQLQALAPVAGTTTTQGRSIGPSLSAGKYLGDRTFLRVDQGTTGGRVTVEVELGGGFSADTRLGEDTGGGVGLSWHKDY